MQHSIHTTLRSAIVSSIFLAMTAGSAFATTLTAHPGEYLAPDTSTPLGVAGDYAPGFSSGSFKANGISKTANMFAAHDLGMAGATIGDLTSFSYWTKQANPNPNNNTLVNWYVEIYTKPDGTDDDASSYGRRLTFEPYLAKNLNVPNDQWVQWSTDGTGQNSENHLRVYDGNRGVYGTYSDPFLSDLTTGSVNWSGYYSGYDSGTYDYRDEEISFIGLSTGSGWASDFNGQLDGFQIRWTQDGIGQSSSVNFEAQLATAVPAPSTAVLFTLGLIGLALGFRSHNRQL